MKSKLWYVMWPGAVYAEGPFRFDEPKSKREFREHLRSLKDDPVQWLPRGTEVWSTTEQDVRDIGRCR